MPAMPRRRSILLAAGAATATAAVTAALPAAAEEHQHPHPARPLVFGHRGSAGWRPEHTAAAYTFVRHENEISQTTDIAKHPEFAERRTTKTVDGRAVTGWFTEDFTLAELKTLRAVERLPLIRNRNTVFDGTQQIMTFQEVVDLARALAKRYGRRVAVFPETKHPTYFRSSGLPLEPELVRVVRRNRLGARECVIQSFEPPSLLRIADARLRLPLWQAIGTTGGPYGHTATYAQMMKPDGLREIAEYADWIGPDKSSVVAPSALLADAHTAGLKVGAYTFRAENQFLPAALRRGTNPNDFGDAFGEYALHYGLGAVVTDFPDLAVIARDQWAAAGSPES
ncbi:glycerophosphodiester phosphodiesterase family protein [Streptomyces sp. NBC_00885]|uniref:glycerophosphodiester phosphodiesterase family protein n=1 Tax=Streptomyces sp. NBC_00885 TaxID=2975857 RepID=UPI0038683A27|nr:glycerophosphodiester phosphodiesterase family protein [Streptomyces sp. NBC_00885]